MPSKEALRVNDPNVVRRPRALLFRSAAQLEKAVSAYVAKARKRKVPLTMAGLAVHLKTNRMTLLNYARGYNDEHDDGFSAVLERAKTLIEADKLEKALSGQYVPAVAIFDLKNNHGYLDSAQLAVTGADGGPIQVEHHNADLDVARRIAYLLTVAAEVNTPPALEHDPITEDHA